MIIKITYLRTYYDNKLFHSTKKKLDLVCDDCRDTRGIGEYCVVHD